MNLGFLQSTKASMEAIYPEDHAEGCACDACISIRDTPELILVGLPHLSDQTNGYARAWADDGRVRLTVCGFGCGELSMPKEAATALRDQLNNALAAL